MVKSTKGRKENQEKIKYFYGGIYQYIKEKKKKQDLKYKKKSLNYKLE